MFYTPSPLIGGFAQNIDLILNCLNIAQFRLQPGTVSPIDIVDQAIGIYFLKQKKYWINFLNPINWIKQALRIPFSITSWAGFDGKRIEDSLGGKIYKLLSGIVTLLASIVGILLYFELKPIDIKNRFQELASILSLTSESITKPAQEDANSSKTKNKLPPSKID